MVPRFLQSAPSAVAVPQLGTVDSVTGIFRAAGSSAGGLVNYLAVTNAIGTPPVSVGGVPASVVVTINPTLIQYITPPGLPWTVGGQDLDVVVGGQTLPAAFGSHPPKTASYAAFGFEDGTFGPFSAPFGDAIVISTGGHTGTHCVEHVFNSSGSSNQLLKYEFGNNPPSIEANGVYFRWWVYVPTATLMALASGQIKMGLQRIHDGGGASIGGWFVWGCGPEISQAANKFRAEGDDVPANAPIPQDYTYVANTWYEIIFWLKRDTVAHTGTAKLWIGTGGNLVYQGTLTDALLGTDPTTDLASWSVGAYSQNMQSYAQATLTDDVDLAKGGWFSEP